VTGLHYCSQYSPTDASLIGSFWCQMHQASDRANAERERRIATEKTLKELRVRHRQSRAAAAAADQSVDGTGKAIR
jgi:hypothetical protein